MHHYHWSRRLSLIVLFALLCQVVLARPAPVVAVSHSQDDSPIRALQLPAALSSHLSLPAGADPSFDSCGASAPIVPGDDSLFGDLPRPDIGPRIGQWEPE